MSARDTLRADLFRTRAGVIAWNVLANQRNRFRLKAGDPVLLKEEAHTAEAAAEKAGYLLHMWREIEQWLGPRGIRLEGARVLELGPGDNLGTLLCALAHGAAGAMGVDKFAPVRPPRFEALTYAALRERLPEPARARLDRVLRLENGHHVLDPAVLQELSDCPAEDCARRLPAGSFDLVLSRSVLEYVQDLDQAFAGLRTLLAPGGWMIHKVDARDDGLFSRHGHHPLSFLTVSHAAYHAMTSHTYRPRRARLADYRDLLKRQGWRAELRVCRVLGQDRELPAPVDALVLGRDYGADELRLLREIRPRLHPHFAAMADADLLATGFFVIARK